MFGSFIRPLVLSNTLHMNHMNINTPNPTPSTPSTTSSSSSSSPNFSSPPSPPEYHATPTVSAHWDDNDGDGYQTARGSSALNSGYVPLVFGVSFVTVLALITRARKSTGLPFMQRLVEARVMTQAMALTGLVGLGYYMSIEKDNRDKQRREAKDKW